MNGNNDLIMKYREQAISTMSKGELVVALYDELLKNLKYGSLLLKQDNADAAAKCTKKCRDIINYLLVTLNMKYDISVTLSRTYSYFLGQIILASAKGDASYLDRILPQAQELRDAWAQTEKKVRMPNGENSAGSGSEPEQVKNGI